MALHIGPIWRRNIKKDIFQILFSWKLHKSFPWCRRNYTAMSKVSYVLLLDKLILFCFMNSTIKKESTAWWHGDFVDVNNSHQYLWLLLYMDILKYCVFLFSMNMQHEELSLSVSQTALSLVKRKKKFLSLFTIRA